MLLLKPIYLRKNTTIFLTEMALKAFERESVAIYTTFDLTILSHLNQVL